MESASMDNDLQASQKRAMQYWFADGLAEFSAAAICLLLAIYFIFQQVVPIAQGSFALIFMVVFLAGIGIRKLMLWVRQKSTYPRTGYVELKHGWEDRRFLGIAVGFTVLLMGLNLFTLLRGIKAMVVMPALGGFMFAFMFALAGARVKLMRFYFLAGFCQLVGIFLALSGFGELWGAALLSFFTCLVLFTFGVVTRLTYLHQSSRIPEQTNER
jgi:hypothetical protein